MKRAALLVLGLGLGLYGLKLAADAAELARAQAVDYGEEEGGALDTGTDILTAINDYNPVEVWQTTIDRSQVEQSVNAYNVKAFQAMIKHAEGTAREADPYRVCYGYRHRVQSFDDHPAVTGEWAGEDISNLGPAYVGKVSTAAGAYQIRKGTWLEAKKALALPDFTPASQDAACVWLIKRRKALASVEAGDIVKAIELCRNEWASLPGGSSGQPQRKLDELLAVYQRAGGYLA